MEKFEENVNALRDMLNLIYTAEIARHCYGPFTHTLRVAVLR